MPSWGKRNAQRAAMRARQNAPAANPYTMAVFSPTLSPEETITKLQSTQLGVPLKGVPLTTPSGGNMTFNAGAGAFNITNASGKLCEVQDLMDLRGEVVSRYAGVDAEKLVYKKHETSFIFSKIGQTSTRPFWVIPVITKSEAAPSGTTEETSTDPRLVIANQFAVQYSIQILPPVPSRLILDDGKRNWIAEFKFTATQLINKISALYYREMRGGDPAMYWTLHGIVVSVDDGIDIAYGYHTISNYFTTPVKF